MKKRIFCLFAIAVLCITAIGMNCFADETVPAITEVMEKECPIVIKEAQLDAEKGAVRMYFANTSNDTYAVIPFIDTENSNLQFSDETISYMSQNYYARPVAPGQKYECEFLLADGFTVTDEVPNLDIEIAYYLYNDTDAVISDIMAIVPSTYVFENVLAPVETGITEAAINIVKQTALFCKNGFVENPLKLLMILIACVLLYLAIGRGYEPLLLLPIAFGMLLTNLPGAEMFHEELFAEGHVHWNLFGSTEGVTPGLLDYLYLGVKLGIYPCLIFFGVGAMTDFGPLIANPKSLLLGAAAQLGIFTTYVAATALGFDPTEAASIGIIGGADGPTAIYVTTRLAPHLLGPIAVAAYSYMALVPVIQPPIMKLLTTKKERMIEMKALRSVSKKEKIIFPIVVTIFVSLLVPSAGPLVGSLMLGNLFRESGVTERLSKTVQNELCNIVTIFLGVTVGATATAETFLKIETLLIIAMGIIAFSLGTAGGVLLAKFMNLFLKNKINPLIGSAGVSAVPMASRVSQMVGQKENPKNFLLMHAMGPNVAGVIGSAIAAGVLMSFFG